MKKALKVAVNVLMCAFTAFIFAAIVVLLMLMGGSDIESTIVWAILAGALGGISYLTNK